VGSYRDAVAMCGTTHKNVRRIVAAQLGGQARPRPVRRGHNYDAVAELVEARVDATVGRISVKRLLPEARTAGYAGSARNFLRRLVAGLARGLLRGAGEPRVLWSRLAGILAT
jgi:hypothetical protein